MQMKKWLDKIENWQELSEWVDKQGTKEDKDFFNLIKANYNETQSRVTFKYKQIPNLMITEEGVSVWDAYDGRLRECRGITFDTINKECILHPFDKFFEVDQVEETRLESVRSAIAKANPATIEFTEKMDGSLTSIRWYRNELVVASMSMNESTFVDYIKRFITPEIEKMCKENPDCTFIFECIEEMNPHVVHYAMKQLGLYMLSYRNMTNGQLSSYSDSYALSKKYNVRHTIILETTLNAELERLSKVSGTECEGSVVSINGWRVKIKGEDYKKLHHTISSIGVNELIERVANGTIDDVYEYLTSLNKELVEKINLYVENIDIQAEECLKDAPETPRDFYTEYLKTLPDYLRRVVSYRYRYKKYRNPLVKDIQGYIQWKDIEYGLNCMNLM